MFKLQIEPIGSMYGIFTYILVDFNDELVGKYIYNRPMDPMGLCSPRYLGRRWHAFDSKPWSL